jgi:hypothetical protein
MSDKCQYHNIGWVFKDSKVLGILAEVSLHLRYKFVNAVCHYFMVQALDLIKELQKHFPIKRAPMRLRLIIPQGSYSSLLDKISSWEGTTISSRSESGNEPSVVCSII